MYQIYISIDKEENGELKNVYHYLQHHDEAKVEENRTTRLTDDELKIQGNINITLIDKLPKE
jgi:hypothetical protein